MKRSSSPHAESPWQRLARTGSRAAGVGVLAAVVLAALTLLLPPLAGYDSRVIDDGSMAPSIPEGSVVLERRVPVSDLRKNDVITLARPGASHPVTRRIVSADRDDLGRRVFWTKGDAEARPNRRPVHFDSTEHARVSFNLPYAGWLPIALGDPELRLLLLGVLAMAIAAATLPSLLREGAAVRASRDGRQQGSERPAPAPRQPAGRGEHGAASA